MSYQSNYLNLVQAASEFLSPHVEEIQPVFGLTLGSGLGDLAEKINVTASFDYDEIPNFPTTTVSGHEGKLIIGKLAGVPIIGLKGRKHYYEVADQPQNEGILQTVFAVHVLAELGIKNYFVTNAAGGLNPAYQVGDAMIIKSHVNMLPNPLLGEHLPFTRVDNGKIVDRFQPMSGAYDLALRSQLHSTGSSFKHHVHQGSYLAVTGPTYETEAECIAFRDGFKADAVGMSTTPEVIVARNRGMKVVGLSCITNKISKDGTNATNHEEVKAILDSSEVKNRLSTMVTKFFESLY